MLIHDVAVRRARESEEKRVLSHVRVRAVEYLNRFWSHGLRAPRNGVLYVSLAQYAVLRRHAVRHPYTDLGVTYSFMDDTIRVFGIRVEPISRWGGWLAGATPPTISLGAV